jgi:hypothetical protein
MRAIGATVVVATVADVDDDALHVLFGAAWQGACMSLVLL